MPVIRELKRLKAHDKVPMRAIDQERAAAARRAGSTTSGKKAEKSKPNDTPAAGETKE